MRVYLDHNATSPLRPGVQRALSQAMAEVANATSVHTSGRRVRSKIEDARETVAAWVGADPSQVIFTSGGTESNHLAWRAHEKRDMRIATTPIEHSSVLACAEEARKKGAEVTYLPVDREGRLDFSPLASPKDFISIQHANNETGVVHPVESIARSGSFIHIDAVQTFGKKKLDWKELGVDALSLSGHKLGAPQGIGALIVRSPSKLEPLWGGGAQERGIRSGTENVLGIVGLKAALDEIREKGEDESERVQRLRDRLETGLLSDIPACAVTGQGVMRMGHVSHITFEGADGQGLLIAADLAGIDCSYGAACASGSLAPSHVLQAMGFDDAHARSAIRFTLGWTTTEEGIEKVLEVFPRLVKQVRTRGRNP